MPSGAQKALAVGDQLYFILQRMIVLSKQTLRCAWVCFVCFWGRHGEREGGREREPLQSIAVPDDGLCGPHASGYAVSCTPECSNALCTAAGLRTS